MSAKIVVFLLLLVAVVGEGEGEEVAGKRVSGAIVYGEGLARAAVGRLDTLRSPNPRPLCISRLKH